MKPFLTVIKLSHLYMYSDAGSVSSFDTMGVARVIQEGALSELNRKPEPHYLADHVA